MGISYRPPSVARARFGAANPLDRRRADGRADERRRTTQARDLYGRRIRLTRDSLAYGEEFVPFDEMDDKHPASDNLWNPATNLFKVAVFPTLRTAPGLEEPATTNRRPGQESDDRCPTRAPIVTHDRRLGAGMLPDFQG
jgi:hypothetical protein